MYEEFKLFRQYSQVLYLSRGVKCPLMVPQNTYFVLFSGHFGLFLRHFSLLWGHFGLFLRHFGLFLGHFGLFGGFLACLGSLWPNHESLLAIFQPELGILVCLGNSSGILAMIIISCDH